MSALDLLTGPDAEDLLAAAVATSGGHLGRWRVLQVDHRPGELTTVAYQARVRWPDGERDDILGASSGAGAHAGTSTSTGAGGGGGTATAADAETPGVITLSDGEQQVSVWCVPHDPDLPGLAAARDHAVLGRLFASFGVVPTGLRTRLIAYRPRRRAVVQVSANGGRWYLKVLRPGEVEGLHRRHRLLHEAGVPVPHSLGWSDEGILVLENLPGTGLRSLLAPAPTKTPALEGLPADLTGLPTADTVVELLDRLPADVLDLPRRTPWSLLSDRYAAMIATALPAERDRVERLARTVLTGLADADPGAEATHGDFYEAQLMVADGRISGLLDVDTAGPGNRADDLACALAHAEALALSHPASAATASALAGHWRRAFGRRVDPVELRLREAGVRISLATGPHRVQRPGWQQATSRALDGVERLLDE